MSAAVHTPGPLHVKRAQFGGSTFVLYGADDFPVASTASNSSPEGMERARKGEHEANAQRIALCWNSHDALLKALKPFAKASKQFDRGPGGHLPTDRIGVDSGITAAMLWAAADAIAAATGSAA